MVFAGTSYCNFICMDRNHYREFAFEYAKFLGFEDNVEHTEAQRNTALLVFCSPILHNPYLFECFRYEDETPKIGSWNHEQPPLPFSLKSDDWSG